jgi:DNA-binding response OmpR family regulator
MHLFVMRERLKDYEVFPAKNTEELYEILAMNVPDLIIMDINMPDYDGFAIFEQLKEDFRYTHIPVIFLTSRQDTASAKRAMQMGAADYLTKPYSEAVLIDSIENQLDFQKRRAVKPTILAVDDNPGILQSIKYTLGDKYEIFTLPNPQLLGEVLEKVTPDLFILDVNMPEVSGIELIPQIRKEPLHENTPIIILTSEGARDTVFAAMQSGACDFIVKPIDEIMLRERLELHLRGYFILRRIRVLEASL